MTLEVEDLCTTLLKSINPVYVVYPCLPTPIPHSSLWKDLKGNTFPLTIYLDKDSREKAKVNKSCCSVDDHANMYIPCYIETRY